MTLHAQPDLFGDPQPDLFGAEPALPAVYRGDPDRVRARGPTNDLDVESLRALEDAPRDSMIMPESLLGGLTRLVSVKRSHALAHPDLPHRRLHVEVGGEQVVQRERTGLA